MRKSTYNSTKIENPKFIYIYNMDGINEIYHVTTNRRDDEFWKSKTVTGIWNVKYKDPVTLK